MFPFGTSRAAAALLELAEAMLAPAPQAAAEPGADAAERHSAAEPCPRPHPHRRSVAIQRRRRPAEPPRPQPCLTPLTRPAGTAARDRDREASSASR